MDYPGFPGFRQSWVGGHTRLADIMDFLARETDPFRIPLQEQYSMRSLYSLVLRPWRQAAIPMALLGLGSAVWLDSLLWWLGLCEGHPHGWSYHEMLVAHAPGWPAVMGAFVMIPLLIRGAILVAWMAVSRRGIP